MHRLLLHITLILTFSSTCQSPVEQALAVAGNNRSQLNKVLEHYVADQDSSKLASAKWLIQNMPYHYSVVWNIHPDSVFTAFRPSDYANKEMVKSAMDSLKIQYSLVGVEYDIQSIKAELLINRIEAAHKTKNLWPFKLNYNQKQFAEYVLPYRIRSEKPENWWDSIHANLFEDIDRLKIQTLDSLAATVDQLLKKQFRYDNRYSYYRPDMNYSEAMYQGGGLCKHCTDLSTMAFRSLGIPCAMDYVPAWGNYRSAHVWNVILHEDKRWYPFNMGEYRKAFKFYYYPPKIFRKTFSINENVTELLKQYVEVPPFLQFPLFKDVTASYVKTHQLIIKPKHLPGNKQLPVISVFDGHIWNPVWFGTINKQEIIFNELGSNILYLPQYYGNDHRENITYPICLEQDGKLVEYIPNECHNISISKLYHWKYHWRMYKENITENKSYNLLLWKNNDWQFISKANPQYGLCDNIFDIPPEEIQNIDIAIQQEGFFLTVDSLPSNGVYLLDAPNQRPFIVKGDKTIYR